jgi:hypothetical protein
MSIRRVRALWVVVSFPDPGVSIALVGWIGTVWSCGVVVSFWGFRLWGW